MGWTYTFSMKLPDVCISWVLIDTEWLALSNEELRSWTVKLTLVLVVLILKDFVMNFSVYNRIYKAYRSGELVEKGEDNKEKKA